MIALLFYKLNKYALAAEWFQKAHGLCKSGEFALADCYSKTEQYALAVEKYNEILEKYPDEREAKQARNELNKKIKKLGKKK